MKRYIKKYAQGFLFAIMFPIYNALWELSWNGEEWKHWLAMALILPVVVYISLDFNKEFMKVRFFSKESVFMYVFLGLGTISCMAVGTIVGLFHF